MILHTDSNKNGIEGKKRTYNKMQKNKEQPLYEYLKRLII